MATVASQVILHPVVSQGLKVLSTTVGRDKVRVQFSLLGSVLHASFQVYRAIQNFARFYAWLLLSSNGKADAAKWNALKSHLALGRKRALLHLTTSSQSALTSHPHSAEFGQTGRTPASRIACHTDYWTAGRTTHDCRPAGGILPLSHL